MKFRVGDRVVVYGNAGEHPEYRTLTFYSYGRKATVDWVSSDNEIHVLFDQGHFCIPKDARVVHPKQCRKLIKKTCKVCGK